MKIRMLIDKFKSDFLTPTNAQLEIELSRTPLNMVNQKHPPQMNAANSRTRQQVNEISTGRGSRGRGGGGRGSIGGRHGR